MPSYNKVILIGHLTRQPELRYTVSGSAVCVFGIATNRHWKDNNGNDKEEVCFAECESWGKRGETVSKYFTKGSPIFIDGRLKFEQWQANDGSKRSRLKIVVENFEFVSGQTKENTENTPPYSDQPDAGGFSGDDIPF